MSPADRAMVNQTGLFTEIFRKKQAMLQSIWHERKEAEEDARKAPERMVKKFKQLADECGATPEEAPELFIGVVRTVQDESVMHLFIHTTPAGRLIIIKQYAEADVQSVAESCRRHHTDDSDEEDDDLFELISDSMDYEELEAFIYCMCEYVMHIDKEEQEEEENDDEDYRASTLMSGSSTTDTATSGAKKSKTKDDQAVWAMVNNIRVLNETSRNKLAAIQRRWHERKETEEDARKALERKVEKVNQLAAECGVTPEEAPGLFKGVVKIVQVESVMDMFIRTTPVGRLIIIKQYAEDARKAFERKVERVNQLAAECGVTPEEAPGLFKGVVKIVQVGSVMDMFIRSTPAERLIIIEEYAGVNN